MSEDYTEYTNIKMPKQMAEAIRPLAKKFAYRSVTEFALDAIRRRIEQISTYDYD